MILSAGMSLITALTSSAALKVAIPETEKKAPSAAARALAFSRVSRVLS